MAQQAAIRRKRAAERQSGKTDVTFLLLVLAILITGLVMLFSASYAYSYAQYGNSYKFILKQGLCAVIGVGVMLIVSRIDYHFWKKFAWIAYIASVGMLAFLLVIPPMVSGMDVKRWIVLGPVNFQPSEVAKFSVILLFSALISSNQKKMHSLKFVGLLAGLLLLVCVLVVAEPHLSATILILLIGGVLMIVGGLQWRYLFACGGVGALGIVGLIVSGKISYGNDRIKYWLDPWADASGKGYQTIQSLLAIGSGGIMGRGIGQSRQKYLWVPEPHNDFIFSIVCEELGLIGALAIIAVFALLVCRGFVIAMRAPDRFGTLLGVGLTFQVGLQAMLNIFVVTNSIPNTGIGLPFFSYGGTSLMILLAEMGIVLSISRSSTIEKR